MSDVMNSPAPVADPTPAPVVTPSASEPSLVNTPPVAATPEFVPLTVADLTLPKGMTLDETASTTLLDLMNNQTMTPAERVNGLINLQASLTKQSSEAGSLAWDKTQQDWKDAVASDPVLGGANLPKTLANVGRLMDQFADDEVRTAFDRTGAGNNPAVVRFLNTLAGKLGEGSLVPPGGPASQQPASTADRIFGAKPN